MAVRFALSSAVRLPLLVRRAAHGGRVRLRRWRRVLDRLVEAVLRDRRSLSAARGDGFPLRDHGERFRQFCPDCRDETVHDGGFEIGPGWCAQICRCCRCGRQSMKVWSWW